MAGLPALCPGRAGSLGLSACGYVVRLLFHPNYLWDGHLLSLSPHLPHPGQFSFLHWHYYNIHSMVRDISVPTDYGSSQYTPTIQCTKWGYNTKLKVLTDLCWATTACKSVNSTGSNFSFQNYCTNERIPSCSQFTEVGGYSHSTPRMILFITHKFAKMHNVA